MKTVQQIIQELKNKTVAECKEFIKKGGLGNISKEERQEISNYIYKKECEELDNKIDKINLEENNHKKREK